MDDQKLVRLGVFGAILSTLFCVTPVLVLALGAIGFSAAAGWLDYSLLPALAVCIGLVVYGLVRRRRAAAR